MAKRSSPVEPQPARLTAAQIRIAIPRLQKRIDDLQAFDPDKLNEIGGSEVTALRASVDDTLTEVFGRGTIEYNRYRRAATLDSGPIALTAGFGRGGVDLSFRDGYKRSRDIAVALLTQAISSLQERLALQEEAPTDTQVVLPGRRVFVVHGHADGPREAVARYLEQIALEPVILHERPNKGRSLLTKFSEEAEGVAFAVVLMTPDDVGGAIGSAQKSRARQNVVFELGFFIGALGAERVAAIVFDDIERPSDFEGVVYIPYDGNWRIKLAQELQAADIVVDWNKVMRSGA
jgi:predicted nucleotide-binding protein